MDTTLKEEILVGRNFGGFDGLTKNSPKLKFFQNCQN